MANTIIALRGKANVGKSQTIKSIYESIISTFPNAQVSDLSLGADVRAIITIDGCKIGIESQGDPNSRLFKSIKQFVDNKCEIIICATRTRGGTVELVENQNPPYNILWIEQVVLKKTENWGRSNSIMAQSILDKVLKLM